VSSGTGTTNVTGTGATEGIAVGIAVRENVDLAVGVVVGDIVGASDWMSLLVGLSDSSSSLIPSFIIGDSEGESPIISAQFT